MGRPRRVFVAWAVVLSALWLLLNWPQDGRPLLFWLRWAGFPWTFAFWRDGQLKEFYPLALAGDIAFGVVIVMGVASLCAWSRRGAESSAKRA